MKRLMPRGRLDAGRKTGSGGGREGGGEGGGEGNKAKD